MPRRLSFARRWRTALTWPFGVALTSWDYMWRTTPLHRREQPVPAAAADRELLELPPGISDAGVAGSATATGRCFTAAIAR